MPFKIIGVQSIKFFLLFFPWKFDFFSISITNTFSFNNKKNKQRLSCILE